MTSTFIKRPVLSIVISIFITLLGLIALVQLPVTQFPDIAPPEVNVTTKFTGANAETCVKAVVTTLERAINGVPGMAYMTSVSSNDGTSIIQIIFKAGTNPDVASVNVQNRVATVWWFAGYETVLEEGTSGQIQEPDGSGLWTLGSWTRNGLQVSRRYACYNIAWRDILGVDVGSTCLKTEEEYTRNR